MVGRRPPARSGLHDAAHLQSSITVVLAKHEFSAATVADGYSRSGAGFGVAAAASGGGTFLGQRCAAATAS
ncbi:thiamine pyrophosphate-binding protein [Mycobacterium tuberculosis]|uniref:thiamine pyrophosphate-binding protein n=1 Tax=Mycobacterium tuberculosis TaxID=1773 RepID=UPI0009951C46|nr:thiamine pyrophosphate-binding protein [Mycobacterium tuberculosis]